jgi:hypothetical protein
MVAIKVECGERNESSRYDPRTSVAGLLRTLATLQPSLYVRLKTVQSEATRPDGNGPLMTVRAMLSRSRCIRAVSVIGWGAVVALCPLELRST